MKLFHVALLLFALSPTAKSFTASNVRPTIQLKVMSSIRTSISLASSTVTVETESEKPDEIMPPPRFPSIIDQLRDVAMKLHTREQAREGQAETPKKPSEPYVTSHNDYLHFLVDSLFVYETLEMIVDNNEKLAILRDSGLERTQELEKDLVYLCQKFDLQRPQVGMAGQMYAEKLRNIIQNDSDIPAFMCHYYNYYFAHLAGGRMIGKQMSKLLLDGETLEFYKWRSGDVNELKTETKARIEEIAQDWSREEQDNCVNETASAFKGGGAINGYLYGGNRH